MVTQQRQHYRKHPQQQPAQQQCRGQQHQATGYPGVQMAGVAEGLAPAALDGIVHHRARYGLEQNTEGGDRQRPATVGQQAHAQHIPARQAQQYLFVVGWHDTGSWRVARRWLGRLSTLAHQLFQGQRLVQPQHAHLRFRAHATGRFQAQFGNPEQSMQRVLPHFHVMDAGKGNLAPVARQQAAAHGDRIAADAIAVTEVLQYRDQHQRGNGGQRDQLCPHRIAVAALAEHQQRDQRQEIVAQLHQQHEQPRPRVQAMLFAAVGQRGRQGRGLAHRASASWSS
ncbi:hypothetical protein D3C75_432500 [compost metagenome]